MAEIKGEVRALTETQANELCKDNFCEKNQVYYAEFSRKRKPAPAPAPTATPAPTAAPTPPPYTGGGDSGVVLTGERLDYAKALMNVHAAWNVSTGSRDVIVAVVDSGVDLDHPDLKNNIWINEQELNGSAGVDDDGNGYVDDVRGWDFYNNRPNGEDDAGHGTHCAGIIGAEINGDGTTGIAPRVRLMPLKFLGSKGSGDTADAVKAIEYAVANGAHIISNSWGGGGRSELLNKAIQRAIAKGIIVTAAAGNEGLNLDSNTHYPSDYEGVLAVGSSDRNDAKSSFSNYSPSKVFVMAAGSSIYSSYVGNTWKTLSGTSMATPQVSGALALALAVNPNLSASQLKSLLCSTSKNVLTQYSQCGRMDVGALINQARQ